MLYQIINIKYELLVAHISFNLYCYQARIFEYLNTYFCICENITLGFENITQCSTSNFLQSVTGHFS